MLQLIIILLPFVISVEFNVTCPMGKGKQLISTRLPGINRGSETAELKAPTTVTVSLDSGK